MLNAGADVNDNSCGLVLPLSITASQGRDEIVRLLLARGARLEDCSDSRTPALSSAAITGWVQTARTLLEYGADINGGWPAAVVLSAEREHPNMTMFLLEQGASLNRINSDIGVFLAFLSEALWSWWNSTVAGAHFGKTVDPSAVPHVPFAFLAFCRYTQYRSVSSNPNGIWWSAHGLVAWSGSNKHFLNLHFNPNLWGKFACEVVFRPKSTQLHLCHFIEALFQLLQLPVTIFRPSYLSFGVANGLALVAAGARFAHFSKEADSLWCWLFLSWCPVILQQKSFVVAIKKRHSYPAHTYALASKLLTISSPQ